MKLELSFWHFEMLVQTEKTYDISVDAFVYPAFNVRFKDWAYSIGKVWRNFRRQAA